MTRSRVPCPTSQIFWRRRLACPKAPNLANPLHCDFFIALHKVELQPWNAIERSADIEVCAKLLSLDLRVRCVSCSLQGCWAGAARHSPRLQNGRHFSFRDPGCSRNLAAGTT